MNPPILYDDLPTLDDKLGWAKQLERLSERIQHCPTPHVLGIHGDWGSGKTSFMRQLQERLGGKMPDDGSVTKEKDFLSPDKQKALEQQIATVWFDAWRYQNESVPVVALLQEMRRQMGALPSVIQKFKQLGDITLRYTLNSLADVGKIIGVEGLPSAEKIEKLGENWEKEHYAQTFACDSIRDHLQQTIKSLLPDKQARVVIFIDDLDRCNPKAAIRLLEGLKIYLSIPNCVFVLGMNERILVDAIREEISAPKETPIEELKLRAGHYLEKICTDIYRLPLPNAPAVLLAAWIKDSDQKLALFEAIGALTCLPPNPRRLKALANQWSRFADKVAFPSAGVDRQIWAACVLVAAYIHQFHRDLWERWHFKPDFWNELKAWCRGERTLAEAPKWAAALKFTERQTGDTNTPSAWNPDYPNPGDIDIFWMDSLIRHYRDQLAPQDFMPLLAPQSDNEATP